MEVKNVTIKTWMERNSGVTSRGKKYKAYDVVLEGKIGATGEDFSMVVNKMIYESDDAPETPFETLLANRGVVIGNKGTAFVKLDAREYQGKWYSSNVLYKFEVTEAAKVEEETPEEKNLKEIAAANQQKAIDAVADAQAAGEDTDLPF